MATSVNPVVYKITSPSNKIYIGQSWNILKRKNRYKKIDCVRQPFLYNSLKKYGFKLHRFEILCIERLDILQDELDKREIYYINQYKEAGFKLMNVREGGSRGLHSEVSKRKMSVTHKRIGNHRKGYITPNESKLKMSTAHKGLPSPNKGKKASIELRKKMSEERIGKCVGENNYKSRKVINNITGKIYNTITAAAKDLIVKRTTLNAMLVRQNENRLGVSYYDIG